MDLVSKHLVTGTGASIKLQSKPSWDDTIKMLWYHLKKQQTEILILYVMAGRMRTMLGTIRPSVLFEAVIAVLKLWKLFLGGDCFLYSGGRLGCWCVEWRDCSWITSSKKRTCRAFFCGTTRLHVLCIHRNSCLR